jgi:hypothetical protein
MILRGCLFPAFCQIFISFLEIQKLDDSKSKKLEALFMSFLLFWVMISQKLIHKGDEKLIQTPPKFRKKVDSVASA